MVDVTRMLLVEDEPLISMMLEDFLEVLGIAVAGTASTVAEALAMVRDLPFDAAILDVNLKGGERSDAVADMLGERGIPFIVSSGAADGPKGRPRLAKPFGLDDLERAVAAL